MRISCEQIRTPRSALCRLHRCSSRIGARRAVLALRAGISTNMAQPTWCCESGLMCGPEERCARRGSIRIPTHWICLTGAWTPPQAVSDAHALEATLPESQTVPRHGRFVKLHLPVLLLLSPPPNYVELAIVCDLERATDTHITLPDLRFRGTIVQRPRVAQIRSKSKVGQRWSKVGAQG